MLHALVALYLFALRVAGAVELVLPVCLVRTLGLAFLFAQTLATVHVQQEAVAAREGLRFCRVGAVLLALADVSSCVSSPAALTSRVDQFGFVASAGCRVLLVGRYASSLADFVFEISCSEELVRQSSVGDARVYEVS